MRKDEILRYLINFASQGVATFFAVLFAGVLLLLGVREYVKYEVREAGQRFEKAMKLPEFKFPPAESAPKKRGKS